MSGAIWFFLRWQGSEGEMLMGVGEFLGIPLSMAGNNAVLLHQL